MKINSLSSSIMNLFNRRHNELGENAESLRRRAFNAQSDNAQDAVRRTEREIPALIYDRRRRAHLAEQGKNEVNSNTIPGKETKPKEGILGDLDGNSTIDGADLGQLLGKFGTSDAASDLDKNGTVDQSDLKLLLDAWEKQDKKA